jgi:hypothetical protein
MPEQEPREPTLEELKAQYPGVDLAYDIALDSYDSLIKRIDNIDGRIQTLLTFAATTTAVIPTVANSRNISFRSGYLYVAISLFAIQLIAGIIGRYVGNIRLLRPESFYAKWLHKDAWTFKKDLIHFAGVDFEHNATLLSRRWLISLALSILYFVEVGFLLVWIAYKPTS